MKDTTTAPALPDAVYEQAVGTFSFYADADAGERAVLRDLLYDAIRDAIATADAAGEARGRAAAFRDVTDAIETLAVGAWNGSVSVSCHGTPPELRWSAGSSKTRATDDLVRVTPIAALRAAAAALGGDA